MAPLTSAAEADLEGANDYMLSCLPPSHCRVRATKIVIYTHFLKKNTTYYAKRKIGTQNINVVSSTILLDKKSKAGEKKLGLIITNRLTSLIYLLCLSCAEISRPHPIVRDDAGWQI